jgi:nitrogen regulatory protein P-II 1
MKQIMAIIRPTMLQKVEHALQEIEHFPGFTTLRAAGRSRGRAPGHHHQPTEWDIDESDRTMLVLVCADELAAQIVDTVRSAARTGLPGDGLIVVTDVAEVVRIRTDERGAAGL